MPTLKNWLETDSDTPPPFPPNPEEVTVNRRQMRSLLNSQSSPEAPGELSPTQLARAYQRSSNSPQQIYQLIKQGTPFPRLANALGMAPEMVKELYWQGEAMSSATGPARYALRQHDRGATFPQIGEKLGVTEAEARRLYAQGHVTRYGADPAVQYGRKAGMPFPGGIFEQPTYNRDTNRNSLAITGIINDLTKQLEPQGYKLETSFEADPLGGRHVIKVVNAARGETIGQPFRLTATPNGVPLISKTGKSAGGYRLTFQGQGMPLSQRLGKAVQEMAVNHYASKAASAARASRPPTFDEGDGSDAPDWFNSIPQDDNYYPDEGGYTDLSETAPPPPPLWDDHASDELRVPEGAYPFGYAPLPSPGQVPASFQAQGNARGPLNVLDVLDVNAKRNHQNEKLWRQINAGDFMRLTSAGQFREENSESLATDQHGQFVYPEGLTTGNYYPAQDPYLGSRSNRPMTPIVSKGTVYPLEARTFIAGNIEYSEPTDGGFDMAYQWGSQKGQGKQLKRDELSLTRKYWQAGPALGVAYPEVPQHIIGQRATGPEVAHIAQAFILDRGGIIPEGQMWKDTSYAPWTFGAFEQTPEKFELRFDPNYSDQEVLKAAGLWDEAKGSFRPRILRQGDSKISAPNGFSKDLLRNNEAGVVNDYEIVETLNDKGDKVKALRVKGYFGNRPNVISAMKLEGWKNLAQDKHIRQDMGLDYDLIMNKPSDSVVANISMLNALPRDQFENLWREVHGDRPAPTRTSSMTDVEGLAKVWQRYHDKNRTTEILPGRVFDADTLKNYLEAGIIKDSKYEQTPPLFEGAEPMYKADLIATGYKAPVRVRYITDVTNLREGHLSNEILRSVEHNYPGLGEHLRELGYQRRDIYNTLFEMHQLNTKWPEEANKPGFSEHGTPVVDLLDDLTGNSDARAGMQALYQQKLADILPDSMRGLDPATYNPEQQKAWRKFQGDAGAQAIRQYYQDALGDDSFIFRLGGGDDASDELRVHEGAYPKGYKEAASYMVNPGLVERFGYIDEETNEKLSELKRQGDYQLKAVWEAVQSGQPGRLNGLLKWLPGRMKDVIKNQEELLASAGARKKWFGTSARSIQTHVHASDYALPRNAMAKSWDDILQMTGLKRTKANRAYLNNLSRAGQLLFGGLRNPASDPITQTGAVLNVVTPDLLKEAGLDIPTTGHPDIFHPHYVQRQGGDNDSDESQVYMVMKQIAGDTGGAHSLVNAFGLKPSRPEEITAGAISHAAGEYRDAKKKLNVTPGEARRNLLGFDPSHTRGLPGAGGDMVLDGTRFTPDAWSNDTLAGYKLNARQIGQSYNLPIRVGINMAKTPAAKQLISEYGGWMYQNPLDKENYQPGSPEDDLFSFFTTFNAFTGSFAPSNRNEDNTGIYYSFRKQATGFQNEGQFGAAGLLAILKRLTQKREGTQAQMTTGQMAALMARSTGDLDATASMIENKWPLPAWEQLDSKSIDNLKVSEAQQNALQTFATGDSPMAQMMRGYGVRNAIKAAARIQRKLQEDIHDPERREATHNTTFKNDFREYVNILQNKMYKWGKGAGSPEFMKDYETFLQAFDRDPINNNWWYDLDPGNPQKGFKPGVFYSWPAEQQNKMYKMVGRLLQKHMTGYGRDENGRWRNLDPSVARGNGMLKDWYKDYDRIRDMMAVNAKERGNDEIESYAPKLDELAQSEVTGPLVREKFTRKQKLLGGISRLFDAFKETTGLNGQTPVGQDFENFVAGRKPYTAQEEEMFRQAELGHQEAAALREAERRRQGYEEPMYFAEGGVLDGPTRLGQTKNGREVIAGEAGREYVVPEGKTRDLGNGLKLFDTDTLGQGSPATEGSSKPVFLAKGGLIDYEAYANAPTSTLENAFLQVAQELSQGAFTGDVAAAKALVGQQIEADIQKMMANPPSGIYKGLYATDIWGRATDRMAQALGPDPSSADQTAWNDYLGDYGISADFQPLDVRSGAVDAATRKTLNAGGVGLGDFLKQISAQVTGKNFSHANYGHVYNAIPGWSAFWGKGRPGATTPTTALSATGAATLARLAGSGASMPPPPGPPFGGFPGSPVGPPTPTGPQGDPAEKVPPGLLNEVVTVPKLTPQLMGEYQHVFDQLGGLRSFDPYHTTKEQIAQIKLAGSRGADVFKVAQRSKSLLYQEQLQELSQLGINKAQESEYRRLIQTYGNGDPDLIDNVRGFTDSERQDLINNIYAGNNSVSGKAERYLFGRMEELHRNVRERGMSLTDTQLKYWDRVGLGYKGIDPEQLGLAHEFDTWFSGQFPALNERIPLANQNGDPTYLGGAHPNFDPAFVSGVLPQARAARLKYEQSELFKNLTPASVQRMRPDLTDVMDRAQGVPFATEQVNQQLKAEKESVRLGQIDRRLADIKEFYAAARSGQGDAFNRNMQPFDDAAEVSFLSSQRQSAYEAAVPLKQQYDAAMKYGDLGTAQRLWDQISPLNTRIGELKDEIGTLTPHIKEHIETLGEQTTTIREDLKERKATYTALAARHDELVKERVGLTGPARASKDSDIGTVKGEMDAVRGEIKSQAKTLGRLSYEKQTLTDLIHEPQGRAVTGLGSRPETYSEQAWNELKKGYAPQKLFWEFQNIQQMQYMAFQPMLQMRNQYLGEQAALGQANYALGAGSMPQSVLSAMAAQANMSRAGSAFGQGVDNSITMGLWKGFTNFLGENEGAGSFLGSAGFDLTSALTAAMGFKMVGGPAISALGKLAGGLGKPYLGPGGSPGFTTSMSAAATSGGGLLAGGLGLVTGLAGYEMIRPEKSASVGEFATTAMYGLGGLLGGIEKSFIPGSYAKSIDDLWDQETANRWGGRTGEYTGAVTDPIPVWVTKMESEVAKQLGVDTKDLPFDRTELAQMVQMAAEDQGLTKQQIEGANGIAERLAKEIADSYTSGVSMQQSSGLRQRAIDVSGYAPGTEGARMLSEWVKQGSLFERQQRLGAASMVQTLADEMNFTPQQRQDMSQKVYDLLASGVSQAQVGRSMQQRMMSNQYYWSAAAYDSGHSEMALMDQDKPWLPKNQEAMWAIEDRRRGEDNARELGSVILSANGFERQGGRKETELGWQRQQLDLEKEFWEFRRKSQLEDFGMQQKLFDFNIRQQRLAMDFEEKQSRVQSAYYEKQYALNKQIFELQTEWQRRDFDKQKGRLDIQRSWQVEDSTWNRESFNLQAGWQMEDLQRALRYASSGRERMDIRRQIERQSIMNDRKETEFDREEARNTTQYDWAKEDLAENRKRFEEMNELQRQQMELGREYWQQQQSMAEEYRAARRASLEEQIALQQEQNQLTVQQFLDGLALTDKQHALETQINETKYQWALDDLNLARQRSKEDEIILGWQRDTANASYFYAFYQSMGYEAAKNAKPELEAMAKAAGELADDMERYKKALDDSQNIWDSLPSPSNPAGPQMNQTLDPNALPDAPMSPAPLPPWLNNFADAEESGIVSRSAGTSNFVGSDEQSSSEITNLLAEMIALQAAILGQLQEGGGVILIDEERLKKAGFLHQSNFSQVYR